MRAAIPFLCFLTWVLAACGTPEPAEGRAAFAGYELHLLRVVEGREVPIPLDDWLEALDAVEGVRPAGAKADRSFINPKTGEVIRMLGRPGDAEIFLPEEGAWVRAIGFFDGQATLNHPAGWPHGQAHVWQIVAELCDRLGLEAQGDGGERYDPRNGEEIKDYRI